MHEHDVTAEDLGRVVTYREVRDPERSRCAVMRAPLMDEYLETRCHRRSRSGVDCRLETDAVVALVVDDARTGAYLQHPLVLISAAAPSGLAGHQWNTSSKTVGSHIGQGLAHPRAFQLEHADGFAALQHGIGFWIVERNVRKIEHDAPRSRSSRNWR